MTHTLRFLSLNACLFLAGMACLSIAVAQSTESVLADFYQDTGGDQWDDNSGWLDPFVDFCDWHGVSCRGSQSGQKIIDRIELPDNNLIGTLDLAALDELDLAELNLRDNRLGGTLNRAPIQIHQLDLSNNRFEGVLPALREQDIPLIVDDSPHTWRLTNNDFSGAIPANWRELKLRNLELSGNRLDGNFTVAFETIGREGPGHLGIADNEFSGTLTPDIRDAWLQLHDVDTFGGLNLCWNDWQIDDPELDTWIANRHVGGEYINCINRSRSLMAADINGSWFNPQRNGEGMTLMMIDRGVPLMYWFSFDTQGRQQWAFEVGLHHEESLQWSTLLETRGDFAAGIRFTDGQRTVRPLMGARLDRLGTNDTHFERRYWNYTFCPPLQDPEGNPFPCSVIPVSDRLDYVRLSEMAGSTCDNQSAFQQYSGAWFDPFRAGEGFIIEALPDDRAVVYWFTYKPDGSGEQAWMIGQGRFESGTQERARIEFDLYQPTGGVYGDDFDPDAIDNVDWGTLLVEFSDADTGRVYWDSNLEDYGSGDYPIVRLARPMLAECNESAS
ncbi:MULTISPECIES: hypothetical protein [unclassified Wenzhouxiangella]|uniref:hypothetical protein n=1 Tax=unclassified Wenzhouxiangella TaxID=2613841 RepID=UPI000E327C98|nr:MULTISPECIES: hypothetical protein [unclassified Wenzhouxiangella]RFF28729.1 hypothetical protein DZK25_01250 [Wenzhouxiangella sp. 15181]RFP67554.1 hypothetical protein DZK26_12165 [Wenzhouxiangella sp. 15190]